jgi:hypothetical protein
MRLVRDSASGSTKTPGPGSLPSIKRRVATMNPSETSGIAASSRNSPMKAGKSACRPTNITPVKGAAKRSGRLKKTANALRTQSAPWRAGTR